MAAQITCILLFVLVTGLHGAPKIFETRTKSKAHGEAGYSISGSGTAQVEGLRLKTTGKVIGGGHANGDIGGGVLLRVNNSTYVIDGEAKGKASGAGKLSGSGDVGRTQNGDFILDGKHQGKVLGHSNSETHSRVATDKDADKLEETFINNDEIEDQDLIDAQQG